MPDHVHLSVPSSVAQAAPSSVLTLPSGPSHSSTSDHGWIPNPLPSTTRSPTTHQLQAGSMSTAISSSDLQQRLHNVSFIIRVYHSISSVCLLHSPAQEKGHPTDTLADHQACHGRSCLPAPQLLELHAEHVISDSHTQSQAPSLAPSWTSQASTSAWSLASYFSSTSGMLNSQYIMRPGKDGVNWTILMRR